VVKEYAERMLAGDEFPTVRVWFDGEYYWLADGFQRIAAAERTGRKSIRAEVRQGTLNDARWDSYGANRAHGLRGSREDFERAIQRALSHPNSSRLSNVAIAKHLRVSEATVRRWRRRLSSSGDEDRVRLVRRNSSEYTIRTGRIGQRSGHVKSRAELRGELVEMRRLASPEATAVVNAIGHWVFACATPEDCVRAVEAVLRRVRCEVFQGVEADGEQAVYSKEQALLC
jgi:hypothetical protein